MSEPFILMRAGEGKTHLKADLLTGTATARSENMQARIAAAFDHADPVIAAERGVVLAMEEARWARRAGGDKVPPFLLTDTRTGTLICSSDDDDYLAKYRSHVASHPMR